jgi:hypothetical protein
MYWETRALGSMVGAGVGRPRPIITWAAVSRLPLATLYCLSGDDQLLSVVIRGWCRQSEDEDAHALLSRTIEKRRFPRLDGTCPEQHASHQV